MTSPIHAVVSPRRSCLFSMIRKPSTRLNSIEKRRRSARIFFQACIALLLLTASVQIDAQTFTNPIVNDGADAYIIQNNGTYYFLSTSSSDITIKFANSITKLDAAPEVSVFTPTDFPLSPGLWYFPQFNADRPWFIVYQLLSGNSQVLQSNSTDPLSGFTLVNSDICSGRCGDPGYLYFNGSLYLISTDLAAISLTPMGDPATISGPGSQIIVKRPEPSDHSTDWEWLNNDQFGCCIEGAYPHIHNGQLSMTFSGNRWQNNEYATGISKYTPGNGGVLNASNWTELDSLSTPNFGGTLGSGNGVWGAAAVRGFTAPGDSDEEWFAFAGYSNYCEFCGSLRHAYVQPITWNSDNTPNFGTPVGTQLIALPNGDPGPGGQ